MREREEYLGDGLYGSIDTADDTLWLRAPRMNGDHVVALEPPVLSRFLSYACRAGFSEELQRALNNHKEHRG